MSSTFRLLGKDLIKWHFYPDPNNLNQSERVVEVSLGRTLLKGNREAKVLEVGNVMSQYIYEFPHPIVDKHDRSKNPLVQNVDIVDFTSEDRFDLILSLSTLEHVGFNEEGIGDTRDEKPDPLKILKAIQVMKDHLTPGGQIWVTWAFGANPALDDLVRDGTVAFPQEYFLDRTSAENDWMLCWKETALAKKYGAPFPAGNALYIGNYKDPR